MRWCILFFSIALLALVSLTQSANVPLIMWSNSDYFSVKDTVDLDVNHESQFIPIFSRVIQSQSQLNEALSAIFNDDQQKPELAILYLKSGLRSDHLGRHASVFSELSQSLRNTDHRVFIPFVSLSRSTEDAKTMFTDLLDELSTSGKVDGKILLLNSFSSPAYQPPAHANIQILPRIEDFKSKLDILSDQKLDVLILFDDFNLPRDETAQLASLSSYLPLVKEIESLVRPNCKNYVSVLTSSTAFEPQFPRSLLEADEDKEYTWDYYFPPWFWCSGLYVLFFILATYFGVKYILLVQTPHGFMAPGKKKVE
ncbi:uncharacterized protein LOC126329584 [Schistocerca gregaria]|uniref:uncharacterized protein LOC126329584 n=1 Tax=Schistocerca gregaria TaxID=7010 RepID=UPI00211DB2E0|nr:uncharacterized protein LOC126329584 [Schistocerca gregaria]